MGDTDSHFWKMLTHLHTHTTLGTISEVSCIPFKDLPSVSEPRLGIYLNGTEVFLVIS